jgi:hypothetical protein
MTAPAVSPLRVPLAAALVVFALLPGCAPSVVSLGADAAYTASEQRSTDEVVDDNKIKIELNRAPSSTAAGCY